MSGGFDGPWETQPFSVIINTRGLVWFTCSTQLLRARRQSVYSGQKRLAMVKPGTLVSYINRKYSFIINHNKQTNVLGFVSLVCIYFMKNPWCENTVNAIFPGGLSKQQQQQMMYYQPIHTISIIILYKIKYPW